MPLWVDRALDWNRDLSAWPLSDLSRRITGPVHQWHVQEAGSGPCVLLLHGAGSSTHTWRHLFPRFAERFHTIAIDLPGQGFTRLGRPNRCGLQEMSSDIAQLCADQGWQPEVVIGHSAGGAIALTLSQHLPGRPGIVGINAALGQFDGIAGWLFPLLAKMLSATPFTARAFSAGGAPRARARAKRLIQSTGSKLDPEGIGLYARLFADRGHVDGALKMMAQWSVTPLISELGKVQNDCLLITGDRDLAVAPKVSSDAAIHLPNVTLAPITGLGHLAHEEDAAEVFEIISAWLQERVGS